MSESVDNLNEKSLVEKKSLLNYEIVVEKPSINDELQVAYQLMELSLKVINGHCQVLAALKRDVVINLPNIYRCAKTL